MAPFLLYNPAMIDPSQHRGPFQNQAGFSLAELTVLLAVIGLLFSLSLPVFLTYYRSATVRGAAADVAAYVNQGRQMAIQMNCSVTVQVNQDAIRYMQGGNCQSPGLWKGAGTDDAGRIPLLDGVTLASTADPIFTNLGAAVPAATFTVTHGSSSLSVLVSASGRVTIGP